MEALTSVCALTLYDMLKPRVDTDLVIREIAQYLLLKKTGGKRHIVRAHGAGQVKC